jgi:hypothetical protein
MNKKQLVLVALMIVGITGLLQAQSFFPALKNFSATEKERLDNAYAISLSSENNGTVEAALAVVAMIKLDVPTDEFPKIRENIEYLKNHGATPMIRYRAFLAGAVFDNPAKFKGEFVEQYADSNDFFSSLDNSTNKPLLSTK